MSATPRGQPPTSRTEERDDAIAVIGAYGLFRVLLVLLAVWTFFAGFALLTQGFGAISFGGQDGTAERIIGAHMLLLAPAYGLLAWRREQYRLFVWLPYAGQLAVALPVLIGLVADDNRDVSDGALLLVVSIIFLVLLVYLWWSSHPLGFFQPAEGEEDDDEEDGPEEPATRSRPGSF